MGDTGRPGSGPIRFKTTFTNTIYEAMKRRGWRETNSDSDWDFIWAERDIAHDTFDTRHLLNWQRVNHFRNDRELCRKDLLVKNLKKRKRTVQKEGQQEEADQHDFWPTTYVLPGEYALFAEETKRRPSSKWIMKPIARSQGSCVYDIMQRGIFIVTKLSQISKWKSDSRWERTREDGPETYVVQRYVTNPYLVAGRKFDMRLYVLVTSYMPMTVWIYRAGFCRFSHARYSNATEDLEDMEKHLTNVAIQKRTDSYDKEFGGKWGIRQLKLHLMGLHGVTAVNRLFHDIQSLILRSLLAVQQVMINDKHCFGLYGYDILFDERLKPWLLEVNASPSLSANTPADKELKVAMLSSVLDVIDLEGRNQGDEIRVGGFDLIHAWGGPTNSPSLTRAGVQGGDGKSVYTTALGAEIPQQRVDRMPSGPETNLPPSGAEKVGNGSDSSRRHHASTMGGASGSSTSDTGGGGGGGGLVSPARNCGRAGGGTGGSGSGSAGSSSTRSFLSLARVIRTGSSDSLSREGRAGGSRSTGCGDTGGAASSSRGGERGNGSGSSGSGCKSSKGTRGGDNDSYREPDRGKYGKESNKEKGRRDERRASKSSLRPVNDSASGATRTLPLPSRGSSSSESERLLTAPAFRG